MLTQQNTLSLLNLTFQEIDKNIRSEDFVNVQPLIACKIHGQKYVNNMLLYLVEWDSLPYPQCFTWEINDYLRYDFDLMAQYTKTSSTVKKSRPSQRSLVLKKHNRFAVVSYDPVKNDSVYEAKTKKHIAKFLAGKQFTEQVDGKKYKIIQTKDGDLTTKITIKILLSTNGQKLRNLVPFAIQNQMIDEGSSLINKHNMHLCKAKKQEEDFMNELIDLNGNKKLKEECKMMDENENIQNFELMIQGHEIRNHKMIYLVKGLKNNKIKRVSAEQLYRLRCQSLVIQYLQKFIF